MKWYLQALKKYAVFAGRARRKEFWMFAFFHFLIVYALMVVDLLFFGIAPGSAIALATIYQLAVFIPYLALGVRRLHDTNRSGWWLLLLFVNLLFLAQEGNRGENRFGSDPTAE